MPILLGAAALIVGAAPAVPDASGSGSGLRVGAARVNITPPPAGMVQPFTTVNDDVYVRAIVIDSAGRRAVMVIADVPMIQAELMDELTARIAAAAGVPPAQIMLGATHTHNTMRVDPNVGGIILPGSPRYVEQVSAAIMLAVKQAEAQMVPARMGVSAGQARLVGGKNSWSPELQRVVEAVDRSDGAAVSNALGVIKFETPQGRPIAFVLNYAINPVIAMALKGAVSGDVPGAAARYVEGRSGGAVALFTIGAAGNPLYRADDAGPGFTPADPRALMQAMGTILGEEAIATARDTRATADVVPISGVMRRLSCPGKITSPLNLPDRCAHSATSPLPPCDFKDRETDPVALKMAVLRIGDAVIVQSDSDVNAALGQRLQRQSPVAGTWVVTLNYGPMRYVVPDADYPRNTYEATASTARIGCAEAGYVSNALEMIAAVR